MSDLNRPWNGCSDELPPSGVLVETKIDDAKGFRRFTRLCRHNRLWFTSTTLDFYVYYEPTHWRQIQ